MTIKSAQLWLVSFALAAISIVAVVFITGRLWHFPLDYGAQEEIPLVQLLVPSFFAIIGSAANYLRAPENISETKLENRALFSALVIAPGLLFILLFLLLTSVFHLANQPGSNSTFPLDAYRLWITILLSLISVSVPVISASIFKVKADDI